jgi:hypothetical protein
MMYRILGRLTKANLDPTARSDYDAALKKDSDDKAGLQTAYIKGEKKGMIKGEIDAVKKYLRKRITGGASLDETVKDANYIFGNEIVNEAKGLL